MIKLLYKLRSIIYDKHCQSKMSAHILTATFNEPKNRFSLALDLKNELKPSVHTRQDFVFLKIIG